MVSISLENKILMAQWRFKLLLGAYADVLLFTLMFGQLIEASLDIYHLVN